MEIQVKPVHDALQENPVWMGSGEMLNWDEL